MTDQTNRKLYPLNESARILGFSHWTLRPHVKQGHVNVTRLGKRIYLSAEELDRIAREGLPSLRPPAPPEQPATVTA